MILIALLVTTTATQNGAAVNYHSVRVNYHSVRVNYHSVRVNYHSVRVNYHSVRGLYFLAVAFAATIFVTVITLDLE